MRTIAILVAGAALAFSGGLQAQAPEAFEVASIRRNVTAGQPGSGLSAPQPGGRFISIGTPLRRLVADAYDGVDVVGGPPWTDTDRFDVNARAAGERSPAQIRQLLRRLLADRFGLVVHTEAREVPVYELAFARADRNLGPRLHESDAKCAQDARNYLPGAQPGSSVPCGDFRFGGRQLTARGMTMAGLAAVLSRRAGRPIVDRTGLMAAYDLEIEWSSDLGLSQPPPGTAGANELSLDGVSLFTALQEQLGLRLQPARGTVDVIVIDHAEPPTPN